MELNIHELDFLLGAVDGVRCSSTTQAYLKGSLLQKLAAELEGTKQDVDDTDEVSDE